MSELTKSLRHLILERRVWSYDEEVRLLDDYERLEADLDINAMKIRQLQAEVERLEDVVLKRNAEIARGFCDQQEGLTAEIKTLCNAVDGETATELHRLEAMVRAWRAARGDDESEAAIELWREACRLAEEKT